MTLPIAFVVPRTSSQIYPNPNPDVRSRTCAISNSRRRQRVLVRQLYVLLLSSLVHCFLEGCRHVWAVLWQPNPLARSCPVGFDTCQPNAVDTFAKTRHNIHHVWNYIVYTASESATNRCRSYVSNTVNPYMHVPDEKDDLKH
jgi:hypothetical protein